MEAKALSPIETATELFGGSMLSPVADPYEVYAQLREQSPVTELPHWSEPAHLLVRYDDVARGLQDAETFSSKGNARTIGLVMGRTILEMEGQEHLRQRRIVTPGFAPRFLRTQIQSQAESIAHELIDGFASSGHADLVAQFTFTFPLRVLARIIGVPIHDFEEFHHWALDLISVAEDPEKGFAAADKISNYLRPILEERRREPREDLLTVLVQSRADGSVLTDEEVLSFLRLLLPAGAETTHRLIGTLMHALLTHQESPDLVAEDPDYLEQAIDEALRWEAPVQIVAREATRPVVLHGHRIATGNLVILAVGSANRDAARFEDPDRFDPGRPNRKDHIAFGFGEHFCLGSQLARLETRVAVQALLQRLVNLRLDPARTSQIVGVAFRSPHRLAVRFG